MSEKKGAIAGISVIILLVSATMGAVGTIQFVNGHAQNADKGDKSSLSLEAAGSANKVSAASDVTPISTDKRPARKLDTVAPTVSASPKGGMFNTQQYVSLVASEPAKIYYTKDGTSPTTSSPIYSSPIRITSTVTLKYFAKDAAGNSGSVASQVYTIDTRAPLASASPPAGSYSVSQSVVLSADEPSTIYYTTDGNTPTTSSPIYNSPILVSSSVTLKYFARDRAGNNGAIVTGVYTISPNDTTDPNVGVTDPDYGSTVTEGTIVISGVSSDSGSGIKAIDIRLVDNSYVPATPKAPGDWSTWSAVFLSVPPGEHRFIARATDNAGNQDWANLDITVIESTVAVLDSVSPDVTITSPVNGASFSSSSIGISGTATDNVGVSSVEYSLNGGGYNPISLTGSAFSFEVAVLPGSSTLTVKASDAAGNSDIAQVTFGVVNQTPIPQTSGEDLFGVVMLYPDSTTRPDSWFMNMDTPNENRKRFDVREDSSITKNPDGSWKIRDTQVRMNVYNKNGYSQSKIPTYDRYELTQKGYMQDADDWKNVELTMFVKLNTFSGSTYFSPYARSGWHSHNTAANGENLECEGTGVKPRIYYDGQVAEVKEMWHNDGYAVRDRHDVTGNLQGRWIGIKVVIYDVPLSNGQVGVKQELWINESGDPGVASNWKKVIDGIDSGGWGSSGDDINCGSARPDQPIFWGGPIVTYRWDNASDVDFKWLSVREISAN